MSKSSDEQEKLNTELFKAVLAGYKKNIDSALKKGANINARDEHNLTPLHVAVNKALEGTMGAVRTGRGSAVNKTYGDVAVQLIKLGADIKQKDGSHRTPLHGAVVQYNKELIDILFNASLEKAGAVHVRSADRSQLHKAVEGRNAEFVDSLLSHLLSTTTIARSVSSESIVSSPSQPDLASSLSSAKRIVETRETRSISSESASSVDSDISKVTTPENTRALSPVEEAAMSISSMSISRNRKSSTPSPAEGAKAPGAPPPSPPKKPLRETLTIKSQEHVTSSDTAPRVPVKPIQARKGNVR